MNSKPLQALVSGLVATAVMSVFLLVGPKMNSGEMAGGVLGGHKEEIGWVLHFVMGVIFSFIYIYLVKDKLPFGHKVFKGLIFGAMVFAFTQIVLFSGGLIGVMPKIMEPGMDSLAIQNLLGHVIFGGMLGLVAKK